MTEWICGDGPIMNRANLSEIILEGNDGKNRAIPSQLLPGKQTNAIQINQMQTIGIQYFLESTV
jgi:hypothetical protein